MTSSNLPVRYRCDARGALISPAQKVAMAVWGGDTAARVQFDPTVVELKWGKQHDPGAGDRIDPVAAYQHERAMAWKLACEQ
eukprot:8294619-Alexandrium_andersonii.AAC.1